MEAQAVSLLLAQCQSGDKRAWDALVDAYWQRLFGFAWQSTKNRELAHDLVQETFLRVVQKLERYDHRDKFDAWLFRILVNLIRDQSRSRVRRPVRSTVIDTATGAEVTDDMPARICQPCDPVHHQEDVQRLYEALEQLPEIDRQVLLLRHYGDMPFKEIAKTLGCPLGTVLARAHRALGKLRVFMEVNHETT
jgi:RNA polymerase sigma-70 factor (ECF subfamily)